MNPLKTTRSKLPPLDFTEEVEAFEAKSETKELDFKKCSHKNAKIEGDILKCDCGASWSGSRLHELIALFNKKK